MFIIVIRKCTFSFRIIPYRFPLQDLVWLKPEGTTEFDIPLAVKILNSSGDRIQVRDDDGKVFSTSVHNVIKPLHATSITGVEDMITLGELQEHTILRNLHIRYNQQLIYVSIFCDTNFRLISVSRVKERTLAIL